MYHTSAQSTEGSITIRVAGSGDSQAVRRLAERDSAPVPAGRVLVALVGDELMAAVSIQTGDSIADPFHHTAELVQLLGERASQLHPRAGHGRRRLLARRLARPLSV